MVASLFITCHCRTTPEKRRDDSHRAKIEQKQNLNAFKHMIGLVSIYKHMVGLLSKMYL